MINTLNSILNIRVSSTTNRLIFYFMRIPWIGKMVNDKLYANISFKRNLAIIVAILSVIWGILNKFIYIGALIYFPVIYFKKDLPLTEQFDHFLIIFILLSLIIAPVSNSVILEPKRDKYICVKLLRIAPDSYMLATLSFKYLTFFIYFIPAVLVFFSLLGASMLQALLFTLLMTAWRIAGEALALWLFESKGILLWKQYVLIWSVIIGGFIAAYVSLYLDKPLLSSTFFFNLPVCLCILIVGAFAAYYIAKYPHYRHAVDIVTKIDEPLLDMGRMITAAREAEVNIKETNHTFDDSTSGKFQGKTGYSYLNTIFFVRHRRFLVLPVIRRLYIIAVACAAGFAGMLIFPDISYDLGTWLTQSLPMLVFVMYFTSIGSKVCKAMFYNCDISLLRYAFYRDKATILENFKIRLLKISGLNLIPASAIGVGVTALILFSGIPWGLWSAVSFIVSILFLSVFFSVHHLFMYYIFQPYAAEFNMKNPFFTIVNGIVYAICLISLQFQTAAPYFAIVVIAATSVYIAIALILVYKISPRTFRIK